MPISTSTASFFVELLRTREWQSNALLFPLGTTQVVIPMFPRNSIVRTIFTPPQGVYGLVAYGAVFGINMLPDVFTFTYTAWGSRIYTGTCSNSIIGIELAFFLPVTEQQPIIVSIANTTALLQYFEFNWRYLEVRTEVEYRKLIEFIERVAVSQKAEAELTEIKEILKRMENR